MIPKNLEEAVIGQLERMDVFPVVRVTSKFEHIEHWTNEQLEDATKEAISKLFELKLMDKSKGVIRKVDRFIQLTEKYGKRTKN